MLLKSADMHSILQLTTKMFAVNTGRTTGLFVRWSECADSISDFPGSRFEKFQTLDAATQYLNKHGTSNASMLVYTEDAALSLQEYCHKKGVLLPKEAECVMQTLFHIGHGLHIEACHFQEEPRVDIRMWEHQKRTRKGISLTRDNWTFLLTLVDAVDTAFKQIANNEPDVHMSYHLGDNVYLTLDSPFKVLHIRKWFDADGSMRPTLKGVTLRQHEWLHILNLREQIAKVHSTDDKISISVEYGYRRY